KEDAATWDGGKSTWGGRARGFGTVPVSLGAQEIVWGVGVFLAGKEVRVLCSAIRINFGYGKRAGPAGLEFSRKDLKAGIEEQDLITDIKDSILDL
nr:hypothetical protein [Tanacetum cinerariifolium]